MVELLLVSGMFALHQQRYLFGPDWFNVSMFSVSYEQRMRNGGNDFIIFYFIFFYLFICCCYPVCRGIFCWFCGIAHIYIFIASNTALLTDWLATVHTAITNKMFRFSTSVVENHLTTQYYFCTGYFIFVVYNLHKISVIFLEKLT